MKYIILYQPILYAICKFVDYLYFPEFCKIWTGQDSGIKVEKNKEKLSQTTDQIADDTNAMISKEGKAGKSLSDTQAISTEKR